jgi:alkylhydroperoxidase family enzyme
MPLDRTVNTIQKGSLMPLIQTIAPEEATGELAKLYKIIETMRGSVGNNAKLFSISPELLHQQMDFIKFYINHPTLSLPLLAAIRIMVSSGEECQFCIDYNTGMLINLAGWTFDQVTAMRNDPNTANLPEREIAMLNLAIKAIRNAHGVSANDLDTLREMGWSDSDILDAVNHATRMLATDIIFNTFKIENNG